MIINTLPLECALLATLATIMGAFLALYLKRLSISVAWPLALSGGSLLALAILDLIPESLQLSAGSLPAIAVMALLTFSGALYWAMIHREHQPEPASLLSTRVPWRGVILIVHSFVDGIAIGVGFSASETLGYIMALAIIAHDLSDGFNIVVLIDYAKHHKNSWSRGWLWANAIAPLLGVLLTLAILSLIHI